ncbi:hypothetical protein B0H13DRAFT_2278898 [Mycena leptocephala]|nr:hypothetical protein B0H13DRAFT_2278898 [Mycena leptocephala]
MNLGSNSSFNPNSLREHIYLQQFKTLFLPKRSYYMRRRYTTSDHLRLRFPMPQLDIGSLDSGEPAIVTSPYYAATPQEVAPQDDAPQQVQSVGPATAATLPSETGTAPDRAIFGQSTRVDTSFTTILGSTGAFDSTSTASATVLSSATEISSWAISSVTASVSIAPSPIPSSLSSSISPGVASATSTSPSDTTSSASSVFAPSSASSASPSTTSAATLDPQTMNHHAPIYAAIILGVLILVACVAAVIACLIRFRARRRDAADMAKIGWDPVVLGDAKEPTISDSSFTGDRDVGEPKRSVSFLSTHESYRPPFDPTYQHPNPFVETAYYSPHQVPPLADSAVYPLPPRPPLTIPLSNSGPYPTARPIPARLADRDPHRVSPSTSGWRTAASSRSGSVRSHLPSATTLCVTNGSSSPGSSRASTALGMHADQDHDRAPQHAADFDFGASLAQSVEEFGTPREREARPRFMSLGSGWGLDVPWRRESFAVRGGGTPGWAPLPTPDERHGHDEGHPQGQVEGWTQTLRASVLGALHAVTGVMNPVAPTGDEARDDDDGLTRAPSMARERREQGWRRFAQQERDLERQSSVSSRSSAAGAMHIPESNRHMHLEPLPVALQHSSISMGSDTNTMRTDNSRVPLIARPRPAALVSRASSVYSTVSAAPSTPAYGYRW